MDWAGIRQTAFLNNRMKGKEKRKRIIVLGGGTQIIPSYKAMLRKLAATYDLAIFSEFHLGSEWNVEEYKIYSVPKIKNTRFREFIFLLSVIKFCLIRRVDIIHSHSTFPSGFVAIIIQKIFRIPVVVCLNAGEATALPDIQFGEMLNPKRTRINRWVVKNADAVTALSQFQLNEIKGNLVQRDVQLIPRGVSIDNSIQNRAAINSPVSFISVSYIHPIKDHETLLHSFQLILQRIPATLTIVGKDYENQRILHLAKQLNIDTHINFVGFVPHESIQTYLKSADILLHTSRFEALPAVATEAMAAGVLVCGTHVGILADLSGECCLTVAPRDFDGLSKQVLKLLESNSLQEKLRVNAYAWTKEHSLSWTVEQYKALYNRLLSK